MKESTSAQGKDRGNLPPPQPHTFRSRLLKVFAVIFALTLVCALFLFWIYGVETHHASRAGIWWPERGRNLIPPTATDITLQRDLLDHYATYTISEKDLNAFLDERFASNGKVSDESSPAAPKDVGKAIGRLDWVVTKDTVVYHCIASNGSGSSYYHDPTTGMTYQSSAYW